MSTVLPLSRFLILFVDILYCRCVDSQRPNKGLSADWRKYIAG